MFRRLTRPVLLLAAGCAVVVAVAFGQTSPGRVGGAGVTVALPRGWHSMRLMVPPPSMRVDDPVTRIVASSGPVRFGKGCNDVDYSFPSTAVTLVVVEWVKLKPHLPPRPAKFTPKTLRVRPPPAIECFNGAGGSVEFVDHGRRLDAFLLLGRRAAPKLAMQARTVLNTLRVTATRS